MLAAPFKKTAPMDWANPLRSYLSSNFPPSEAETHFPSVQRLATVRTRVQGAHSTVDNKSVEACEDYLELLAAVQPRFPVGEDKEITVSFTWHDAFKPSKKVTHYNVVYERACVMFNLAAMESHKAMSLDRIEIDSLKEAKRGFSRAANLFLYLRDTLVPEINGPLTTDLSYEGLNMLFNIMAAQAQACFYEFALRQRSAPKLLASLASQASEYYRQAVSMAMAPTLSSVLDKSWMAHLDFQLKCFASSAEYQYAKATHAKADKEGSGYGEEIARLALARERCNDAIQSGTKSRLPRRMLESLGELFAKIQNEETRAREDNNTIYIEPVPAVSSLKAVPKTDTVKTELPDARFINVSLAGRGPSSVFRKLLPAHMHKAEAKYQSELAKMLQDSAEQVQKNSEELRVRLAEAGLPAAVEAGDSTTKGFPEAVWKRVVESVQSKGGVDSLYSRLNVNESLAQNVVNTLNRIEGKLRAEKDGDAQARDRFGPLWEVATSEETSSHMHQDVERYRKLVQEARNADHLVSTKMSQNRELLSRVQMSKPQLDKMIPNPQDLDDNPDIEKLRLELSILLVELGSKVQEAEVLQTQLVSICEDDSIVQDLLDSPLGAEIAVQDESTLSKIIAQNIAKHESMTKQISQKVEDFFPMLSRILDKNHMYAQLRTQNEVSRLREEVISEINGAIAVFEELNSHVDQGANFWNDISSRCDQLDITVSDHCYVRELQRKEESDRIQEEQRKLLQSSTPSRGGLNRELSVPSISAYTVGDVAMGTPVNTPSAIIEGTPSVPPPAYPGLNGGGSSTASAGVVSGEVVSRSQDVSDEKVAQLRSLLGPGPSKSELEQLLEGAGGNANVAANHYFNSHAGDTDETRRSSKTKSSKGFFKRFR